MSKEFDRIVEYLKEDADYEENPGSFVLYASVEPYDPKNPDHHLHEDYEDDTNDFEDDFENSDEEDADEENYEDEEDADEENYEYIPISECTHVVRCIQAGAYTGTDFKPTDELMQMVDGFQLNIILTDSDIKVIRGGDGPDFMGGEIGDAREWCKEYSGEFYENIDVLNRIVLEANNDNE